MLMLVWRGATVIQTLEHPFIIYNVHVDKKKHFVDPIVFIWWVVTCDQRCQLFFKCRTTGVINLYTNKKRTEVGPRVAHVISNCRSTVYVSTTWRGATVDQALEHPFLIDIVRADPWAWVWRARGRDDQNPIILDWIGCDWIGLDWKSNPKKSNPIQSNIPDFEFGILDWIGLDWIQ